MKKILLTGNPNVGKSAIFNRLTGLKVVVSNYPGTTVEFTEGELKIGQEKYRVIDVPGIYSFLEPTNEAEDIAAKQIFEVNSKDIIINVVDATNLERNLYLTLQLLELKCKVIIALNLWDDIKHKGIEIDVEKLQKHLNVPVVATSGMNGYGIKDLVEKIKEMSEMVGCEIKEDKTKEIYGIHGRIDDERWKNVGKIIKDVQRITHKHHTLMEKIQDLTIKPSTGIPLAIFTIILTLIIVKFTGEFLISQIDVLFEIYLPFLEKLSEILANNKVLHDVIVGELIDGEIDFFASFGILSTGLYIPFAAVLPFLLVFYFVLAILEDSGYLPRISVIFDSLFHKIGSHGHGIIPTILGLGCRVPGVIATRILETKKQKFIILTLLTITVPCMANTSLLVALFATTMQFEYIALVFFILIFIYFIIGFVLNKVIKEDVPELLIEIPPYRKISFSNVFKKTWFHVKIFLFKTVPLIVFGIAIISVLNAFKFTHYFDIFTPLLSSLFGLPGAVALIILTGFLRKDVAVGMLIPFVASHEINIMQTVIAAILVVIFVPCIATIGVMIKEMSKKEILYYVITMLVTTVITGIILKILLIH